MLGLTSLVSWCASVHLQIEKHYTIRCSPVTLYILLPWIFPKHECRWSIDLAALSLYIALFSFHVFHWKSSHLVLYNVSPAAAFHSLTPTSNLPELHCQIKQPRDSALVISVPTGPVLLYSVLLWKWFRLSKFKVSVYCHTYICIDIYTWSI